MDVSLLEGAVTETTGLVLRGGLSVSIHYVSDVDEFRTVLAARVKKTLGQFGARCVRKDSSQIPTLLGGWYPLAPTDVFINIEALNELIQTTGADRQALVKAITLHELAHVYLACGAFDPGSEPLRDWEAILAGPPFDPAYDSAGAPGERKAALKEPIAALLGLGISSGFIAIEKRVSTPIEGEMLAQCIAHRASAGLGQDSVRNALELLESIVLARRAPLYLEYRKQSYAGLDSERFKSWLKGKLTADRDAIASLFKCHFDISYMVSELSTDEYPLLTREGSKRGILTALDWQSRESVLGAS